MFHKLGATEAVAFVLLILMGTGALFATILLEMETYEIIGWFQETLRSVGLLSEVAVQDAGSSTVATQLKSPLFDEERNHSEEDFEFENVSLRIDADVEVEMNKARNGVMDPTTGSPYAVLMRNVVHVFPISKGLVDAAVAVSGATANEVAGTLVAVDKVSLALSFGETFG
jgi:hypothetical protein